MAMLFFSPCSMPFPAPWPRVKQFFGSGRVHNFVMVQACLRSLNIRFN